jgi:hypothetical protein
MDTHTCQINAMRHTTDGLTSIAATLNVDVTYARGQQHGGGLVEPNPDATALVGGLRSPTVERPGGSVWICNLTPEARNDKDTTEVQWAETDAYPPVWFAEWLHKAETETGRSIVGLEVVSVHIKVIEL